MPATIEQALATTGPVSQLTAMQRDPGDFIVYGVQVTFTAVNQLQPATINIDQDGDFIWMLAMYSHTDTTSPQVNGGSLITVSDQGSGRQLIKRPVPIADVFGTAQRPFILPYYHRFARSGSIDIQLTNQGIAAQVVRLTFAGTKIFSNIG
jgi:hypothetical protein